MLVQYNHILRFGSWVCLNDTILYIFMSRRVLCAVPPPSLRCSTVKGYGLPINPLGLFASQEANRPRNVNWESIPDKRGRMCRHLSIVSGVLNFRKCLSAAPSYLLALFGGVLLAVGNVVLGDIV